MHAIHQHHHHQALALQPRVCVQIQNTDSENPFSPDKFIYDAAEWIFLLKYPVNLLLHFIGIYIQYNQIRMLCARCDTIVLKQCFLLLFLFFVSSLYTDFNVIIYGFHLLESSLLALSINISFRNKILTRFEN